MTNLRWELVAFGLGRTPEQLARPFDYFYELHVLTGPLPLNKYLPLAEIHKVYPPKFKSEEDYKAHIERLRREANKGAAPWLLVDFQQKIKNVFDGLFSGEQFKFTVESRKQSR